MAGVMWKAGGDGVARAYGYSYDSANRLTQANFTQQNAGSSSWTKDLVDFTASGLSYDPGGNILGMMQKGLAYGKPATVDSLSYRYFTNSNQLQKVSDGSSVTSPLGDFKDSTNAGDDYTYDANGNTTRDYNRHMVTSAGGSGAVYNFLNKPDSIVINGHAGIHYTYDVAGTQLAKQVNDYTSGHLVTKTWQYIGGFVYCNDTLQYLLHEEGQIRNARKVNSSTGAIYYAYEYDYFVKDHQGNVRTVLTEGSDTATYAATMESKDSAVVAATFSNVYSPVNTVWPKPSGFDTDTSNHNVAMLNPVSGTQVGPSIVLKVMRGDQVQLSTYSFYNSPVQSPQSGINLLNSILSVLGTGVISSSTHLAAGDLANVNNALNPNVTQFLNNGRSYDTSRPKAYLNWILFDDQFNYVAGNSGVVQVSPGSSKQALVAPMQSISKNGYLYVYVSNESQQNVYFDNLTVKQMTGPLQQEQSYYPHGLPMAGISDKALLKFNTPYKANGGTELEEDYGLQYYNTAFRRYDPQLGRFEGIDLIGEKSVGLSGYAFGGNNPVTYIDPLGLEKMDPFDAMNDLINSPNGGTWSAGGELEYFGSQDEAFAYAAFQIGIGAGNGSYGTWGSIPGMPRSFDQALQRYNGGKITAGMAEVFFQETWETTGQATDISAGNTIGGFLISGTAISSGNEFEDVFFTTDFVRRGFENLVAGKGESESAESKSWEYITNMVIGDAGIGWGGKENILDFAAKFDHSIEELRYFKMVKSVSKGLLGLQVAVSVTQAVHAWTGSDGDFGWNDNNRWGVTAKSALDVGMAVLGTFGGPIGWVIAGTYFLLDATTSINQWGEEPE